MCRVVDQLSDINLFAAIVRGDRGAFENLFQTYYASLCRYAQTFLEQPGEAEDAVQDVFVNIWNRRENIDIHIGVSTYLYSSVKHRALDILKHHAIERNHGRRLQEFMEDLSHTDYSEEEERQLEQIKKVFQELPAQCQAVFVKNCFEGKKYSEIAEELNISVNTVKSHMLKAYRTIREEVTGHSAILFFFFCHHLYRNQRRKTDLKSES